MRIGINGFGRIGRNAARILLGRKDAQLVAVNSSSDASSHAYLLAHDSTHGKSAHAISAADEFLVVDGKNISVFRQNDPALIPWQEAHVDVVLECTGKFRKKEDASKHLHGSVSRVVISAPAKDDTPTYVMGVNNNEYKGEPVVSNSSCTTNCVSTTLKVLHDAFGVKRGNMTTVHAVTDSQNLLDNSHKKEVRLRRASLVNLIPAASGSATDVAKLFPHLAGRLPCRAIRVPTPDVSLIDLIVEVGKKTTREEVNAAFMSASASGLKGILAVSHEELVSSDYVGNPASSIVDPFLTEVVDGTLIHVTAWYDNEWGYANRLVDLAVFVSGS